MKLTVVPAHTLFPDGEIATLTGSNGFTVMVTALDVAGLPVMQEAFEVITQVMASLLAGV